MTVLYQNIGFLEAAYEAVATTTTSQTAVARTSNSKAFVLIAAASQSHGHIYFCYSFPQLRGATG
jgi:hypothetical protein